jgi:hypothetical protein
MDLGKPWVLRGIVIALAVTVGAIAWMATREGDDEAAPEASQAEARIVSEAELAGIASSAGHPVYWAGPVEGTELEVTEDAAGGVLVRYLEDGAGVGEGTTEFLAIGSYPIPDPAGSLDGFAAAPGATVRRAPGIGRVVTSAQTPTSVYFVDPRNQVQVEVYDDSLEQAMRLTRSGRVQPVG